MRLIWARKNRFISDVIFFDEESENNDELIFWCHLTGMYVYIYG
jgi:hypothetical protein